MGMGALLVAGGVATRSVSPHLIAGNGLIAFWGAVAVGAVLLLKGLLDWQKARGDAARAAAVAAPAGADAGETSMDDRMAIRAMAFVAAIDGALDDGEIAMIQAVSQRLLGDFVSTAKIGEVFEAMRTHDFMAELTRVRGRLTEAGADAVVRSAILAALSDGEMIAEEEARIVEIANLLGVGGERLQASVNEAHAIHDELIRAQDEAMAA